VNVARALLNAVSGGDLIDSCRGARGLLVGGAPAAHNVSATCISTTSTQDADDAYDCD
jgi:hypothetical protein